MALKNMDYEVHPKGDVYRMEIPAQLDIAALEKRVIGVKTTPRQSEMIKEIAETALKMARPLGLYKTAHVKNMGDDKVDLDGVIFNSKVLNKLFAGSDMVIPFIVTEGKELDEFPLAHGDMMKQFYLDTIKTIITANAVQYLRLYVQKKYNLPQNALMNPGEIEDWHISEQKPLFSLFGDVEKQIGVKLTGGGVMRPIKSRSGIIFPNDKGFETCQLCLQARCPGRRCKFEPELYKFYLGKDPKAAK
jgi:hypothetical protein